MPANDMYLILPIPKQTLQFNIGSIHLTAQWNYGWKSHKLDGCPTVKAHSSLSLICLEHQMFWSISILRVKKQNVSVVRAECLGHISVSQLRVSCTTLNLEKSSTHIFTSNSIQSQQPAEMLNTKWSYVFFICIFSACRFLLYNLALQHATHRNIQHDNITNMLSK